MPVINIDNGRIQDISTERGSTLVTVRYREPGDGRWNEQTIVLVVGPRAAIFNQNGRRVSPMDLSVGMRVRV